MKKEQRYKHFVITRFNIRANYGCTLKNPDNNPMKRILEEDYFYINNDVSKEIIEKLKKHNFITLTDKKVQCNYGMYKKAKLNYENIKEYIMIAFRY